MLELDWISLQSNICPQGIVENNNQLSISKILQLGVVNEREEDSLTKTTVIPAWLWTYSSTDAPQFMMELHPGKNGRGRKVDKETEYLNNSITN